MFIPGRWAAVFINSLAAQRGEIGEGINALGVLASWVKSLPSAPGPGAVFGSAAADRLEKQIREGMAKTGTLAEFTNSDPALEAALRLIVLMVRKNVIRHIDSVIDEIKKLVDKKAGIVRVSAEYAFPPGGDFESRLKETIRKRTGAAGVEITGQVKAELIGGYRLRIGDEIIDASVRCQLKKLENFLVTGTHGGNSWQITKT